MLCKEFPGITPHRSGMPGSVWDLEYHVWLGFADAVDQIRKAREKESD